MAGGGMIGFAGCSENNSDPPPLIMLTIENRHTEPHTFHVQLTLDEEVVYQRSKRVVGNDLDDGIVHGAELSDFPRDAKPYVIHAWRDDQTTDERRTLRVAEYDSECLSAKVKTGEDRPYVAIEISHNCHIASNQNATTTADKTKTGFQ
jgi:hypothetical protein